MTQTDNISSLLHSHFITLLCASSLHFFKIYGQKKQQMRAANLFICCKKHNIEHAECAKMKFVRDTDVESLATAANGLY